MKRAALSRVGRLELVDLQAISDKLGRDFLPHPFVVLQPSRFGSYQEYESYLAAVPGRLEGGDLQDFAPWITSYINADIRVECVVSIVGARRGRMMAHRRGQSGFVAAQNDEEHCVDVFAVAPYELGPAVAGSLALTQPGKHSAIVIPGLVRPPAEPKADKDEAPVIMSRDITRGRVSIARSHVLRLARIQSHWQPARDWGFDRSKSTVSCVNVSDDGDYIYAPDFDYLTPMTMDNLADRIDAMIAEDVARLRQSRST